MDDQEAKIRSTDWKIEQEKRQAPQRAQTAGCNAVAGKANPEPLLWRLMDEADSYGEQAAKKNRAIELLQLHPEFEDLIELLRIVNI
jgi:hypothetical protein